MQRLLPLLVVVSCCCLSFRANAADSVAPAYPGPNHADEPLRNEFSLAAATDFLDAASADWWQSRQCFTCHTNYSYLLVRPGLKKPAPAALNVRQQLEDLVEKRWTEKGPRLQRPDGGWNVATLWATGNETTIHPKT